MKLVTGPILAFSAASTSVALAEEAMPSRADRVQVSDERPSGTLGVSLGVGTNGFIGGEARGIIGPGVGWEARVTSLDNRHIRAELSYIGSTQKDLDDATDVSLRSHGVQATLRINVVPSWRVEPFFYIGVGVSRLSVINDSTNMFGDVDYVLDNPFGIGGSYHYGRFVFDLRASVSVETGADIVTVTETMEAANLNRFGLRFSVGAEL